MVILELGTKIELKIKFFRSGGCFQTFGVTSSVTIQWEKSQCYNIIQIVPVQMFFPCEFLCVVLKFCPF